MSAFFVTSSGTEIGKTLVSAALVHQARERGMSVAALKPVLSGFDPDAPQESDAGILLAAMGQDPSEENLDCMTPFRFRAALSPDMAAKREGRVLKFSDVVDQSKAFCAGNAALKIIEGVGGIMAPIDDSHTVLDWAAAMALPAVLVVGGYLGTISHTLTAAAALQEKRVSIALLVISAKGECPVPPEETGAAIARYLPNVPQAIVPDLGDAPQPWRVAPDLLPLLLNRHS